MPPDDDNARDLAVVYNNLGMTQDALGLLTKSERWEDAVASYVQAIECQRTAAERAPQVTRFQHLLAKHQDNHLRAMRKRRTGL